jgi:hypothetical protein
VATGGLHRLFTRAEGKELTLSRVCADCHTLP